MTTRIRFKTIHKINSFFICFCLSTWLLASPSTVADEIVISGTALLLNGAPSSAQTSFREDAVLEFSIQLNVENAVDTRPEVGVSNFIGVASGSLIVGQESTFNLHEGVLALFDKSDFDSGLIGFDNRFENQGSVEIVADPFGVDSISNIAFDFTGPTEALSSDSPSGIVSLVEGLRQNDQAGGRVLFRVGSTEHIALIQMASAQTIAIPEPSYLYLLPGYWVLLLVQRRRCHVKT